MPNPHTLLLADGTQRTIPEIRTTLAELGCDVIAVADASYVLSMALRHKPGAVVLGARLPAGGALTALRRLRASVHCASVPVVALAEPGGEKQALLSAGAEECLEPPVANDELVAAVMRRLGMTRAVTEAPGDILRDPARLAALGETGLLDSEPDEALDVITRLAAVVLGVPVALVSLVDDHRQFFKSQVGLPTPWDERRQTPLSHSFCQWVVSSQEELVVADARVHPVLAGNGAVAEIGVVAYAGVPLSAVTGQSIGSFCAIDGKPRAWTDDDMAALRAFALLIDAQAALNLATDADRKTEERARHFGGVVRAAARGFQSAARLLRSERCALQPEQRRTLIGIIERQSHQLEDVVADAAALPAGLSASAAAGRTDAVASRAPAA